MRISRSTPIGIAHSSQSEALRLLADELRQHPVVTLVYALHDTEHNHAVVLEQALREMP